MPAERQRARAWYVRARDYAQEHGVNQVYFEVEAALARLEGTLDSTEATHASVPRDHAQEAVAEVAPEDAAWTADLDEIRGGVGAMRRALVPAFV